MNHPLYFVAVRVSKVCLLSGCQGTAMIFVCALNNDADCGSGTVLECRLEVSSVLGFTCYKGSSQDLPTKTPQTNLKFLQQRSLFF